jgi:peptidoglycan/LPS O-acetylase OafA/YrhL
MKTAESHGPYQSRARRSTLRLFLWVAIWVASFAIATFGPKFIWDKAAPMTWIACAVTILIGIGAIVANRNQIRDQDEMLQRISLEGYAITLGAVIIVGCPYSILQGYKLVPAELGIPVLMVVVSVTLLTSMIVGVKRYR